MFFHVCYSVSVQRVKLEHASHICNYVILMIAHFICIAPFILHLLHTLSASHKNKQQIFEIIKRWNSQLKCAEALRQKSIAVKGGSLKTHNVIF